MRHFDKNHKHSSSSHNLPQHEKPKLPTGPAPGGRYTPQKPSFLQKLREKIQKKPETPATREQVMQLGLEAAKSKHTFTKQYFDNRSKQLKKKSSIWGNAFGSSAPSGDGRRTSVRQQKEPDLGIFGSSHNTDSGFLSSDMGTSEGFNAMFGINSQKPTKGRGKQQKSGIEELF